MEKIQNLLNQIWRSIEAASMRRARNILDNHRRGLHSWD